MSKGKATVGYTPQIVFMGDSRVGKTTLIGKLTGIQMDPNNSNPTLKQDFVDKYLDIGVPPKQETVNAKLYDLKFYMGQSPNSIMRYKDIVVLVWSLTDYDSFRNMDTNIHTICDTFDSHNQYPPDIVLCANKCDEKRDDNEFDLCKEQYKRYPLVKTSRDGTGIQELESIFCKILVDRYNVRENEQLKCKNDSIDLSDKIRVDEQPEPNCC